MSDERNTGRGEFGASAGATITLVAEALRTSGVRLSGAGDIPSEAVPEAMQIWEWLKEGKLAMDIKRVPLSDVSEAWERDTDGKRIVLAP